MDEFVRVVFDLFRETEGEGPVWDWAIEQLLDLERGSGINALLILAVPLHRN